MLAPSHILTGMATGLVVAQGQQIAPETAVPLILCCGIGAILPDIDSPSSLISRLVRLAALGVGITAGVLWFAANPMPAWDGWLRFVLAFLIGGLVWEVGRNIPNLFSTVFGHRGLVHSALLGVAILILAWVNRATIPPIWMFLAVGWVVHLVGDALSIQGIPWFVRGLDDPEDDESDVLKGRLRLRAEHWGEWSDCLPVPYVVGRREEVAVTGGWLVLCAGYGGPLCQDTKMAHDTSIRDRIIVQNA
jgi:membrane-bound metal-dependent hydrolase YbcI (DUF457 family)